MLHQLRLYFQMLVRILVKTWDVGQMSKLVGKSFSAIPCIPLGATLKPLALKSIIRKYRLPNNLLIIKFFHCTQADIEIIIVVIICSDYPQ